MSADDPSASAKDGRDHAAATPDAQASSTMSASAVSPNTNDTSVPQPLPLRKAIIYVNNVTSNRSHSGLFPSSQLLHPALWPLVDVDGMCKPILHVLIEQILDAMKKEQRVSQQQSQTNSQPAATSTSLNPSTCSSQSQSQSHSCAQIALLVPSVGIKNAIERYFRVGVAHDDDAGSGSGSVTSESSFRRPQQTTSETPSISSRIKQIANTIHVIVQKKENDVIHSLLQCESFVASVGSSTPEPFLFVDGSRAFLTTHPDPSINYVRQLMHLRQCVVQERSKQIASNTLTQRIPLCFSALTRISSEVLCNERGGAMVLVRGSDLLSVHPIPQCSPEATRMEMELAQLRQQTPAASPTSPTHPSCCGADAEQQQHGRVVRIEDVLEHMPSDGSGSTPQDSHLRRFLTSPLPHEEMELESEDKCLAFAGMHIFTAEIMPVLRQLVGSNQAQVNPRTGDVSLSSLFSFLIRSAPVALTPIPSLYGLEVLGHAFPIDSPSQYARCMEAFSLRADECREMMEELDIIQSDQPHSHSAIKGAQKNMPRQVHVQDFNTPLPKRTTDG